MLFSAWVDCWLMPWLVFHGWLSLVTLLHHTAPHVPFEGPGERYDIAQVLNMIQPLCKCNGLAVKNICAMHF